MFSPLISPPPMKAPKVKIGSFNKFPPPRLNDKNFDHFLQQLNAVVLQKRQHFPKRSAVFQSFTFFALYCNHCFLFESSRYSAINLKPRLRTPNGPSFLISNHYLRNRSAQMGTVYGLHVNITAYFLKNKLTAASDAADFVHLHPFKQRTAIVNFCPADPPEKIWYRAIGHILVCLIASLRCLVCLTATCGVLPGSR